MSKTVGVGVFGCGGVSAGHFNAYVANPRARLVAAVDVSVELAQRAAEKYGAERYYGSVEEALADPEIEMADLCLPHQFHAPVGIDAMNAGKHVFVEKPIANTLAEADSMIAAADANGVLLMVDQTKRYQNRHRRIKELLEAGYVGDPILVKSSYPQDIIEAWSTMPDQRKQTYWKHDGVISGIGIHALDLLRWFLGDITEVYAVSSTSALIDPARSTEDTGLVLLKFANGAIGESTVSYVLKDPKVASNWDAMPIQIFGTEGAITMDADDRITVTSDRLRDVAGVRTVQEVPLKPSIGAPALPSEGMAGAIDHFLECLLNGAAPLTGGPEARQSLEVVEAAYLSIAEHRPVSLPLTAEGSGSPLLTVPGGIRRMTVGYVLRRIGVFFIVLWVAATVNFILPRLAPGDPVRGRLAESQVTGVINQSGVNAMVKVYDQQFGLDKPVIVQYFQYLWNCLHFDFGFSISSYPTQVSSLIAAAIPWTATLLLTATIIAFVLGSFLGAIAAWPKAPHWIRYFSVPLMGLSSVPYYLIGLVLIYLFAVLVPVLPSSGGYSVGNAVTLNGAFFQDAFVHSILPALSIVLSAIGFWALSMRGMMVSTSGEDYINFAEAKGLRPARIFFRYGVRNAILPQVTHLALSLGTVVSGSIIVEVVFGYPGVGTLLFKAVTGQDYFVIYGVVFIVVLAIAFTTLIIDLVYPLIDPRINYKRS